MTDQHNLGLHSLEDYVKGQAVWAVAELDEGGVKETTYEILDEGRELANQLEGTLCCVLIGQRVAGFAESLGHYEVDAVYLVEHPLLVRYNTDGYTAILTELVRHYKPFLLILSATPTGRDLAPRLAARLRTGLVTDCVMLESDPKGGVLFTKPTHQDKVHTTITCSSTIPCVATLRPGVVGTIPPKGFRQPELIHWEPRVQPHMARTRVLDIIKADPKLIDVSEAELIVAGGRGVNGEQGWQLMEELAEVIGASVGGTRIAMDTGHISRERMIGQTGKSVSPKLYLAAGISGAPHHLGGIDSEFMIAINTDRNAPIFRRCNLGIVGDLHEILPVLIRRLRPMKPLKPSDQ